MQKLNRERLKVLSEMGFVPQWAEWLVQNDLNDNRVWMAIHRLKMYQRYETGGMTLFIWGAAILASAFLNCLITNTLPISHLIWLTVSAVVMAIGLLLKLVYGWAKSDLQKVADSPDRIENRLNWLADRITNGSIKVLFGSSRMSARSAGEGLLYAVAAELSQEEISNPGSIKEHDLRRSFNEIYQGMSLFKFTFESPKQYFSDKTKA